MNLKNAVLGLLAFTGNVASADEVRAVRPGIRGDRPAGSVLPDADSKETLPEGNAGAKSDLEEHRIVPEDDALDEDNGNEIGSEVEAPGHTRIYNTLYATSNVDLLKSKDGSSDEDSVSEIDLAGPDDSDLCLDMRNRCRNKNRQGCNSVYDICSQEVASRKFDVSFTGVCLDSKGRAGYPNLVFENLSSDQCKAKCNDIPGVRVRGLEVGKVHSYDRPTCVCLMDRKDFSGCQEFDPSLGYISCNSGGRRATSGTGPVKDGDSNPKWTCFADLSSSDRTTTTSDQGCPDVAPEMSAPCNFDAALDCFYPEAYGNYCGFQCEEGVALLTCYDPFPPNQVE